MRILFLNEFGGPAGGTERYLETVARGLRGRGYGVGLLHARGPQGTLVPGATEHCGALGERSSRSSTERVLAAVQRFAPDLIHINRLPDYSVVEALAERWPTVLFWHDHFPVSCPGYGKFFRRTQSVCERAVGPYCLAAPWIHGCGSRRPGRHLRRYLAWGRLEWDVKRVRRFLVASQYMAGELKLNGVVEHRVAVVGLPGPAAVFDVAPGRGVLFVGRMTDDKGPARLLEALELTRHRPPAVFVGEGPLRAALTERARRQYPEARFLGPVLGASMGAHYAEAALVVVPSLWPEPFGLVGLEAMAFGKPVVAFDRGGIREWLDPEVTGRLVEPSTAPALAAALDDVLGDGPRMGRWGEAGRTRVQALFSTDRHLDRLEQVYAEAAGRASDKRAVGA